MQVHCRQDQLLPPTNPSRSDLLGSIGQEARLISNFETFVPSSGRGVRVSKLPTPGFGEFPGTRCRIREWQRDCRSYRQPTPATEGTVTSTDSLPQRVPSIWSREQLSGLTNLCGRLLHMSWRNGYDLRVLAGGTAGTDAPLHLTDHVKGRAVPLDATIIATGCRGPEPIMERSTPRYRPTEEGIS